MQFSPINFCGRTEYLYGRGETKREQYKDMETELKAAYTARMAKVSSAPVYKAEMSKPDQKMLRIKHEVEGEPANTKTNPITPKHIENLLQNLFLMDKAGLYHTNLSSPNIYYSKDGGVEFATMRDMTAFQTTGKNFTLKRRDMLNFAMPSNAEKFETSSLSRYVNNLKDEKSKRAFIREYLTQKSDYNKLRAEALVQKGFKGTDKALEYEIAQSKVFKDPDDDVLSYFEEKLEISRLRENANIMWHKAGGFFDGNVNPTERFASVVIMLNALKSTITLRDNAEYLSTNAKTPEERQYFAFEKELLNIWAENIRQDTRTGGADNFCNKGFGNGEGLFLGRKEDRDLYYEFFDDIKIEDSIEDVSKSIDTVIEYYKNLIAEWTPEENEGYKLYYLKEIVGV